MIEVMPLTRVLQKIYWAAAAACFLYYIGIGISARFGLDMSWMWLVAGGALTLAGFACKIALPGWVRAAWRALVCAGLALLIALLGLVISGMRQTPPANLDYLIVLGARVNPDGNPSPALQNRLNAAIDYLAANPETIAIVSGGQGADEPVSEAACIRDALVAAGVDPDRILVEDQSTSTAENLTFSLALIDAPDDSVGLVTNNFHVCRATRLAQKAGYGDVHGVAADYTGLTLPHFMVREAACLIADWALGNL